MNKSREKKRGRERIVIAAMLALLSLCMLFCGCEGSPEEELPPSQTVYTVSYVAGTGGIVVGEATQKVEEGKSASEVKAVPDEGYKFVGWSDSALSEARTDTNVTKDMTLTASFEKLTYSVEYKSTDGGKVVEKTTAGAIASAYSVYYGENTPTVTAEPSEGYRFTEWSDGVKDPVRKEESVKRNMTLTAKFERIIHTATYTSTDGGGIEGNFYQRVYDGDDAAPVTAIAYHGYKFMGWSDGVQSETRTDTGLTESIEVRAIFKVKIIEVSYKADEGGHIEGKAQQSISFEGNAATVTAVPDEHYDFVGWSDGVKSAERTDTGVTKDISVTALFELKTYKIVYDAVGGDGRIGDTLAINNIQYVKYGERTEEIIVKSLKGSTHFLYWSDGFPSPSRSDIVTGDATYRAYFGYFVDFTVNNGEGGKIVGNTHQPLRYGEDSENVTAVANEGYVFSGWSDLIFDETRNIANVLGDIERVAYFERIEKTFALNYGEGNNFTPKSVTLSRNDIKAAQFSVPSKEGYAFLGWYADKDYTVKVANENGVYMLGLQGLNLETDTLYARWKKNDEAEGYVYKVLLVYTSRVQATLYSTVAERDIDVDYDMSGVERNICLWTSIRFAQTLNEWFEGTEIVFEVDSYFTNETVGTELFYNLNGGKGGGWLRSQKMPETWKFAPDYHSILTSFNLNDKDERLLSDGTAGLASEKYGEVKMDLTLTSRDYQRYYDFLLNFNKDYNDSCWSRMETYIHEFVHTVEYAPDNLPAYEFHEVLYDGGYFLLGTASCTDTARRYLLGQAEYNGTTVGIPMSFWRHEETVHINYTVQGGGGDVEKMLGNSDEWKVEVFRKVPYGSIVTARAVPKSGYRFLMWSDGVMTPERIDRNIISCINVFATFEKVEDEYKDFNFQLTDDGTGYTVKVQNRNITEAVIPSVYNNLPVTEVCDNGFIGCSNLNRIVIPESVCIIGRNAFMKCTNLQTVQGMGKVEEIRENAFALCTSLKELIIPASLQSLGNSILRGVNCKVYLQMPAEQINSLNPKWNEYMTGEIIYIGNSENGGGD